MKNYHGIFAWIHLLCLESGFYHFEFQESSKFIPIINLFYGSHYKDIYNRTKGSLCVSERRKEREPINSYRHYLVLACCFCWFFVVKKR